MRARSCTGSIGLGLETLKIGKVPAPGLVTHSSRGEGGMSGPDPGQDALSQNKPLIYT